jgi:hypothetical protein
MISAPGLVLGGIQGVRTRFPILRSENFLGQYRVRRVPFACFVLPNSFSTVPRVPGPIFMFCTPELVFDGTKGIGSQFHILRSRTHFRQYRGRRVTFSFFVLPNPFWAVPRASGLVCMFCAPGLVWGGTDGVGSHFHVLRYQTRLHVLRSRTRFQRYRGRRVQFSCFALPV